jgi:hypothetical protein
MIKLTIKHEKKEYSGTLPETWQEIKVKHFIGMNDQLKELELIELLSGINLEFLENTETDFAPVIEKMNTLFNEPPPDMLKLKKKTLQLNGKSIDFPKSIEFTRFGQKSMVKNLIQEHKNMEAIISDVFAIYAQPIMDGKFDSNRIELIKGQIDELPIVDVFPHVLFFFQKLRELKQSLQVN